jgi:hypothetical protein
LGDFPETTLWVLILAGTASTGNVEEDWFLGLLKNQWGGVEVGVMGGCQGYFGGVCLGGSSVFRSLQDVLGKVK